MQKHQGKSLHGQSPRGTPAAPASAEEPGSPQTHGLREALRVTSRGLPPPGLVCLVSGTRVAQGKGPRPQPGLARSNSHTSSLSPSPIHRPFTCFPLAERRGLFKPREPVVVVFPQTGFGSIEAACPRAPPSEAAFSTWPHQQELSNSSQSTSRHHHHRPLCSVSSRPQAARLPGRGQREVDSLSRRRGRRFRQASPGTCPPGAHPSVEPTGSSTGLPSNPPLLHLVPSLDSYIPASNYALRGLVLGISR